MNAIPDEKVSKLRRKIGRMFRREVPDTEELRRIRDLPRRLWQDDPELDWLVRTMSWYCRIDPEGTATLLRAQAKALQEAYDLGRGLFGPQEVGSGKTLLTFLLPQVLEAERPLLVVPAKLLHSDKTKDEFAELSKTWKTHPAWLDLEKHCVSYEFMSRENGTKFLQDLRPDLVVFDEGHHVRNIEAAVTRRFDDYFTRNRTRVVVLTGTSVKRSLLDFDHFLRWCLPEELQPLPQSRLELEAWAAAVDEIKKNEQRVAANPRVLKVLCNETEIEQGRDGVRSAVRRRVHETPGVVAYAERGDVEASLNVELTAVTGYGPEVLKLARKLNEGVLPNGDPVTDNDLSAQWRNYITLTSGFHYQPNPRPPQDWLEARRDWKKVVRGVLATHEAGLESEMLVARAAKNHHLGPRQHEAYARWAAIRDTFKERREAVWLDDTMVEAIGSWCSRRTGIVWVSEIALGERLEKVLGLPYYHELGRDRRGRSIKDARPDKDGCVVASVAAASEGNNLQAYCDNLVISPPPTGTVIEQILGRTHRRGQLADEVWCEFFFGCVTEWRCYEQALRDCRVESLLESEKKLSYATKVPHFKPSEMRGSLWS